MRKLYLRLLISISFIFLFMPNLKAQGELPFLDPDLTISMDFQDAGLKDILKIFSIQSGLNFIASEAVQDRKVTLFLDKVPIKEAMDKFFEANNLSYKLDEKSRIVTVLDWGTPDAMTITKVFTLKYVPVTSGSLLEVERNQYMSGEGGGSTGSSAGGGGTGGSDIVGIIQKIVSSHGQVIADIRTNSLIVTDIPSRFPTIEETIAKLDIAVPQILLEVEMLDVTKQTTENLGFLFSGNPINISVSGASARIGFPFGDWSKIFLSDTDAYRGQVSVNSTYNMVLEFLKTQTDTKYLARPRLLTLNNQTAEIRISSNEAIGVSSTTSSTEGGGLSTATSAERAETGVILRVTPQINIDTGEITMFIYPKVNEALTGLATFSFGGSSYTFHNPEERSTKTLVRVKDGETVVIGGLMRNRKTEVATKLPFFGDIPLIGKLFFTNRHTDPNEDRELLIFITPRIIKENNVQIAKVQPNASILKAAAGVTIPEREQTAIPQDRLNVINNTLGIFDSKNK